MLQSRLGAEESSLGQIQLTQMERRATQAPPSPPAGGLGGTKGQFPREMVV